MNGYFKYFQKEDAARVRSKNNGNSHIRILLSFKNECKLAFDDVRKFGKVGLTSNPQNFIHQKKLGPDALEISLKTFKEIFKGRKGIIKSLIMNQNFIAGIGNLYADEILYQSRIHPLTKADKLKAVDIKILFKKMKLILNKAIEHHDRINGLPSSFLLPHRYPGCECPEGGPFEIMKIGGRTTYFCPNVQKKL